jgi:hypothetical protein
MRKLQIHVLSSPPSSWTWRVYDVETKKTLRSGSTKSREEALAAAKKAKGELESQVGID